jgi:hypothetical protein
MSLEKKEVNNISNKTTTDLLEKNMEIQNKEIFNFFGFSNNEINDFYKKYEVFNKLKLNF